MNEEDDLEAKEDDAGEAHEESKLGKLFDKAKGKAAEGLEAAKSGVRKGASAGKALAKKGAKATKGFVESGAVKGKVEKTKAVTRKLAKATGEGTKLAAGKVKEASAKAFEKTAEGASAAAKATKHFAGKVAEKTVEGGTTAFEKVRETAESVGEFTKEKLEGAKEALGGRKAGPAEPQSSEPQNSEGGARSAGEPEFLGRLGEAKRSAKAQREAPEPREGDARTEAQTDLEPNQKSGETGTAKNGRAEARDAQAQKAKPEEPSWSETAEAALRVKRRPLAEDFNFLKEGFAEPQKAEAQSSEPQSSGSGPQSSGSGARSAGEPEFLGRMGEAKRSAKAQREAPEPREGDARTEAQTAWEPNQKAGGAGTAKNGRAEAQSSEPQSSGSGARSAGEPEFLGRLGEARQSAKAQREAPEPREENARTEVQTAWEPNQKAGKAGTAKNGRAEAREAQAQKAKPEEAGKAETMAEELDQTAGAYAAKTKGKKFLLAVACAGALAGGGLTYSVVGPRYTIAEEFALTYDCIFNQKQKISARNYEKLAECCAEVVEKLEEKFPSLESIADKETEVASQIQESCRNE